MEYVIIGVAVLLVLWFVSRRNIKSVNKQDDFVAPKMTLLSARSHDSNNNKPRPQIHAEFRNNFDQAMRSGFSNEIETKLIALRGDNPNFMPMKDRVALFEKLANGIVDDYVVTPQELAVVNKSLSILDIPESLVSEKMKVITTLAKAHNIEKGNSPNIIPSRAILKKNEFAKIQIRAVLMGTEKTRVYKGGSQGISFRIAKGVHYRVGAQRGTSHTVENEVAVSSGELVVTNKRVIFTGDQKSFAFNIDRLLSFDLGTDGVVFHLENRVNPHYLRLFGIEAYLLSAALSWAANQDA